MVGLSVCLSVCLSVHLSTCLLVENAFTIVQFCQGKNLTMLQFGLIQHFFFYKSTNVLQLYLMNITENVVL